MLSTPTKRRPKNSVKARVPAFVSHVQTQSIFCHARLGSCAYNVHVDIHLSSDMENQNRAPSVACDAEERMLRTSRWKKKLTFQLHFLLSRSFSSISHQHHQRPSTDSNGGETSRYKILPEHCEHATVVIGRQENSIASFKITATVK